MKDTGRQAQICTADLLDLDDEAAEAVAGLAALVGNPVLAYRPGPASCDRGPCHVLRAARLSPAESAAVRQAELGWGVALVAYEASG